MRKLNLFLGSSSISISETMQKIDKNENGILFILDSNNCLVGCVTDGDIRRYLLSGGKMEDLAIHASNRTPQYAFDVYDAKKLYHHKNLVVIPIVDQDKHVIDLYFGEESDAKRQEKKALGIPVVINAGGKGTRLAPYTNILPKPLIPIGDIPILEHIIQEYQTYNCKEFHVIVNYKKELIKAYFSENKNEYDIQWHNENKPLGTGGGLSLLKEKLTGTFFFANCDSLIKSDYCEMLEFHRKNHNIITMICAQKNINVPYGVVETDNNGTILEMKEKPLLSFLTNAGMYIVEPKVFDYLIDDEAISFPEIIERVKKKGEKVAAFPISERDWMDMGQFDEMKKMISQLYGE